MARWDPGTERRIAAAALELFMERGYGDVTVTDIAERAGITRRTYFRYFSDKREVLFAGSEKLPPAVYKAVRAVDRATPPLAAALEALDGVGSQLVARSQHAAERRAVIEASPELQERHRTKLAEVAAAIGDALTDRGTAPDTAHLAAQTATIAYESALTRWAEAAGHEGFASCLDTVTASLRDVVGGR